MSIQLIADEAIQRLSSAAGKRKAEKIRVYGQGVVGKIRHAQYALARLTELNQLVDTGTPPADGFTIDEKIRFHVDSFFAFLCTNEIALPMSPLMPGLQLPGLLP